MLFSTDFLVYGPPHLFRKSWLSGAKDYLRDPWQPDELFLRMRGPLPVSSKWYWGECRLLLDGMTIRTDPGCVSVHLSRTESDLLRILVQRQGQVVSRSVLSWAAHCSEGRVVDTLMARLRGKLQRVAERNDDPVPSVRGLGYRLP